MTRQIKCFSVDTVLFIQKPQPKTSKGEKVMCKYLTLSIILMIFVGCTKPYTLTIDEKISIAEEVVQNLPLQSQKLPKRFFLKGNFDSFFIFSSGDLVAGNDPGTIKVAYKYRETILICEVSLKNVRFVEGNVDEETITFLVSPHIINYPSERKTQSAARESYRARLEALVLSPDSSFENRSFTGIRITLSPDNLKKIIESEAGEKKGVFAKIKSLILKE